MRPLVVVAVVVVVVVGGYDDYPDYLVSSSSCPSALRVYVYEYPGIEKMAWYVEAERMRLECGSDERPCANHFAGEHLLAQFSIEMILHDFFRRACIRTMDPKRADLFYVPFYADVSYRAAGRPDAPSRYERAILDLIEHRDPRAWERSFNVTGEYWLRKKGADHVLVQAAPVTGLRHPKGKRGWVHYLQQLTPPIWVSLELSRSFLAEYPMCAAKNIVVPYPVPGKRWQDGTWRREAAKKNVTYLAYCHAGDHGCVALRKAIKAELRDVMPPTKIRRPRQVLMHQSRFCPCPEGDSPSAKRQYDAVLAGCVPVLISDDALWAYTPPFGTLRESDFALRIPEAAALDRSTLRHLRAIDDENFRRLRRGARRAAMYYSYYKHRYYDRDPLVARHFPDGGALHHLVRALERRSSPSRWPACERELKDPHYTLTTQYCGAVPVASEISKLEAHLARATDHADRQSLAKAIRIESAFLALRGGPRFRVDAARIPGLAATTTSTTTGVLFSAAGSLEFVSREVLPAARSLEALRTPTPCALVIEEALRSAAPSFFSPIITFESIAPSATPKALPAKARAKFVKVVAMAAAPFEITIFLDFDARPCRPDFAALLIEALGSADVALTNKFRDQATRENHLDQEHNSACVVLRRGPRTRELLEYYVEAFLRLRVARDQPALMVALKKARGNVLHADIPETIFCRNKISETVSCDAGCVLVHKPQKHDLGLKIFAISNNFPGRAFELLKLEPRCDAATRTKLADDVLLSGGTKKTTQVVLEVAENFRAFWGEPWSLGDVYRPLVGRFPRAKFVMAAPSVVRWKDVDSALAACEPRKRLRFLKQLTLDRPGMSVRQAYEHRLATIRRTIPPERLLVLEKDRLDRAAWSRLCSFVETWTPCPDRPVQIPALHTTLAEACPNIDAYKTRVAKRLNETRVATPRPPKPVVVVPRQTNNKLRLSAHKAAEIRDPPRWLPVCAPRYPRGILYNRIPKSGSASVMAWMAAQLNATAKQHGLATTNVTWWTPHVAKHRWLSPIDERAFVASIRHFGSIGRFVTQRHVYHTPGVKHAHPLGVELVNVVRDPIDRCVSRYNYEAFYKKRIPAVDFNDCLESRCSFDDWTENHVYQDFPVPTATASPAERELFLRLSYNQSMMLLLDECHDYMTRWFCGHGPECRTDPDLALRLAKKNVVRDYAHVGVLEDLPNTVQLFRLLLPSFFEGDPAHTPDDLDFPDLHSEKALLRKDARAPKTKSNPLSAKNLLTLFDANRRDLDLYFFILDRHRRRVKLCLQTNGSLVRHVKWSRTIAGSRFVDIGTFVDQDPNAFDEATFRRHMEWSCTITGTYFVDNSTIVNQ
ncbi:hypothetical protein CTAYLR_005383 [Chrysophaeum taylorii]|uniref:Exostosin GT47 domain-containing protein n=1 Tax=Chrysophaeum taylorii TaxID=2483200 RepID=A0AAD7U7P3_9STRA|nr:hypothetical protein CTAYLR_005383 [Chrysophaeum taylorii]